MPATTSGPDRLARTRRQQHPHCWVCSPRNGIGLGVDFRPDGSDAVTGRFPCDVRFTGYPGFLHGGVISALLDGAMTNCLMARGMAGVTAALEVRYLKPVLIGTPVVVRGRWERSRGPVQLLAAELRQDDVVLATATGRFMAHPTEKNRETEGSER